MPEATDAAEVIWQATDAGTEMLSRKEPVTKRIRDLFAKDLDILSGYRDVINTLKTGNGTFVEVEEVIKKTSLYQVDNKHASMFLKRLEDAGAIEWRGKWVINPSSEELVNQILGLE